MYEVIFSKSVILAEIFEAEVRPCTSGKIILINSQSIKLMRKLPAPTISLVFTIHVVTEPGIGRPNCSQARVE